MKVTLSGKTVIGRGWDGGVQVSDNDTEVWKEFAEKFKACRPTKVGFGIRYTLDISVAAAIELHDNLSANGDYYTGMGMDGGCYAEGAAMIKDATKIRKDLFDPNVSA